MPRIRIGIAIVVGIAVLAGLALADPAIVRRAASIPSGSRDLAASAAPALSIHLPGVPLPGLPAAPVGPTPTPQPSGFVVVANQGARNLVVVDAATKAVSKIVPLGIPARALRVGPDGQTAWVFDASRNSSDVFLVDILNGQLIQTKRLLDGPSSVAFSSDGARAYVPIDRGNRVSFLDLAGLNEIASIPLGQLSNGMQMRRDIRDAAIATVNGRDQLYVAARGSGLIWALDASTGQSLAQIEAGGGPLALVGDALGQRIYAVTDTINQLIAIDPASNGVIGRIPLPGRPSAVALAPNGDLWVAGADLGEVWVIDPQRGLLTGRVRVGSSPSGIAFSSDGNRAYVTNESDGTLAVIDVPARRVIATVRVGSGPIAVAYAAPTSQSSVLRAPISTLARPTSTAAAIATPTAPSQRALISDLPPDALIETFVPGANYPVALAFAPDGRLFYNELRTGKIRIVQNGNLQPEPFYQFEVAGEPETGLISLTLDPNFAANHYVYVFYTDVSPPTAGTGGPHGHNQVVRLTDVNGKGTDLTPILRDLPAGPIHNSGHIRFGPDGKLYVSIGENNVMSNSQDLGTLAGKILRVNPDGTIPSDNPFVGQPGRRGEIWASGLRNSFSFDFEPHTGGLFATENGPGDDDEINLITRGSNYGWPPAGYQDTPGIADPLAVFNPTISPTGLTFYRASQIPQWTDDLFYCNYHQRQLRRIQLATGSYDRIASDEVVTPNCTMDVQTGPDGALYFTDESNIFRVRESGATTLTPVSAPSLPAASPTEVLPAGTLAEDRDVDVSLEEYTLIPSRAKVPAGSIQFVAENLGTIPHALRIQGNGVDVSTESIPPKANATLTIDLSPGTYTLTCPIENHSGLGMSASLTVVGN